MLIVFGPRRIPEIGRSIGKGITEFKKGMKEVETELSTTDRKSEAEESRKS